MTDTQVERLRKYKSLPREEGLCRSSNVGYAPIEENALFQAFTPGFFFQYPELPLRRLLAFLIDPPNKCSPCLIWGLYSLFRIPMPFVPTTCT